MGERRRRKRRPYVDRAAGQRSHGMERRRRERRPYKPGAKVGRPDGGAAAFDVDPASVAANESFDKFANQLADAQGAGSDARLAVNQGANPSSHLSPAGVDLIIRQLRGNADYLQAQGRLAANYPDQTNVRKFQTDLGDNLDPRVFQYARMTPEQKMAFYRSMPNKAEFQKSYYWSQAHNLLPPPVPVAAPAAPVSAVAPSTPNQ